MTFTFYPNDTNPKKAPIFCFYLLVFLLIGTLCFGQNIRPFQIHIPTSPQADAFARCGKNEINPATGTPNIAVPLYTIDHMGYSLPLSLHYTPTPLKPNYNYDVYGQGWSISINSAISRTIEYVPDELADFKLNTSQFNQYYAPGSSNPCISCLKDYNYALDKFNVILPDGSSFNFMIDNTNYDMKYIVSDNRLVKISWFSSSTNVNSFKVIDENGITYIFEGADRVNNFNNNPYPNSYVSWLLKRIELPNSTEPIEFSYNQSINSTYSNTMYYEGALTLGHFFDAYYDNGNCNGGMCPSEDFITISQTEEPVNNSYEMKLLTSVSYGNRRIALAYKNPNTGAARNYVDKISFFENEQLQKVAEFHTTVIDLNDNKGPINKLNSMVIKGSNNFSAPEVYKFDYDNISSTSGIDPWGYCNYMDRKGLPPFKMYIEFDESIEINELRNYCSVYDNELGTHPYTPFNLSKSGPVNSSNFFNVGSTGTHGILKKITYPTKGYTEFEFENHRFLTSTKLDGTYDSIARTPVMGSGFRIKTIKNYASNGNVEDIKNYKYGERMLLASEDFYFSDVGKAPAEPNLFSFMSLSNFSFSTMPSMKNMLLGLNESGSGPAISNLFNPAYTINHWNGYYNDWSYQMTFCGSNFRKLLGGRAPVLYPKVTVIYGSLDDIENLNGKTVYEYNISDNHLLADNDGEMYERPMYYGNTLSYIPRSYSYPLLMSKEDYSFDKVLYNQQNDPDECFKLSQRENYLWTTSTQGYTMEYINTNPFPTNLADGLTLIGNFFQTRNVSIGGALMYTKVAEDFKRGIQTSEYYTYSEGSLLSSKTTHNSSGQMDVLYEYPIANTGNTVINKMIDKNMRATVLKQTTKLNNNVINNSKVDYQIFGSGLQEKVLPEAYYQVKNSFSPNDIPDTKILSYTTQGNPKEVVSRKGEYTIYLWGYNERYLIAEIKMGEYSSGAYSSIESAVSSVFEVPSIDALALKAFNDTSKANLILQQESLRTHNTLKDAFVTTYTYNRFGKPTSITNPAGLVTHYEYDDQGKLERVKDSDSNILGENKYNYKQ